MSKGFTLVEMLVVVAIIGVLAAVLVPNLLASRGKAHDTAGAAYARNCYLAVLANQNPETGQFHVNASANSGLALGQDYHCAGLVDDAGRVPMPGGQGPNGNGTASVPFGGIFNVSATGRILTGATVTATGRTFWYDGNRVIESPTRP